MYVPKRRTDDEYIDCPLSVEDANPRYRVCFYCGKHLLTEDNRAYRGHERFAVQWRGNDGEATIIMLHANCAELLALHLVKDVRSGELRFE